MTDTALSALKIIPDTYEVYLASGEPNQYPLSLINNLILVKDPIYPDGFGWFDEREFNDNYKWVNSPPQSFTDFSPVEALPDPPE